MSSAGADNARVGVQSLQGLFPEELGCMILVGSFQLTLFCHAVRGLIPDVCPWRWRDVAAFLCSVTAPQSSAENLAQVITERSTALLLHSLTLWKIGSQTIQGKRGRKASLFHAKWAVFSCLSESRAQGTMAKLTESFFIEIYQPQVYGIVAAENFILMHCFVSFPAMYPHFSKHSEYMCIRNNIKSVVFPAKNPTGHGSITLCSPGED